MAMKKPAGKPFDSLGRLVRGSMRKATWREPIQNDANEFLDMLLKTEPTTLYSAADHVAYYLDVTMEKAQEFFINWNKARA